MQSLRRAIDKFVDAAEKDDIATVAQYVKNGIPINAEGSYGETALAWAAKNGSREMVLFLTEHGADKDQEDNLGLTPLMLALKRNHTRILQFLLGDVNHRDLQGRTPLHIAQSYEAVRFLVDNGADVNARDEEGRTPLHVLCKNNRPETDAIRYLLDHGAKVDLKDSDGDTPFLGATIVQKYYYMKVLLSYGADINATDGEHQTSLFLAALRNDVPMVKTLLDFGADFTIQNVDGYTAIQATDDERIIKLIEARERQVRKSVSLVARRKGLGPDLEEQVLSYILGGHSRRQAAVEI